MRIYTMKQKIGLFIAFAFLSNLFVSTHVYSEEVKVPILPLEYFTKLSVTKSVTLSPDGKHYVIVLRKGRKDIFAVIKSKTNKTTAVIGMRGTGKSVGNVTWVSNKRLVYTATESYAWDKQKHMTGDLFAVNLDGSKHDILFTFGGQYAQDASNMKKQKTLHGTQRVIDYLDGDEKNILITFYPFKLHADLWRPSNNSRPTVFKLNVFTGKRRKIDSIPIRGIGTQVLTDNNGNVRFATGVNNKNELVVSYKETNDSEWQNFSLDTFEGVNVTPRSFTKDNQGVYISANVGNGTRALYLLNLKEQTTEKIFHDEAVDIGSYMYDFKEKRVVGIKTELELPKYHYLDKSAPKVKLHKKLMQAFPDNDVVITSASRNGKQLITYVYADNNPGDYYLFDTKTMGAQYLTSQSDWVNPNYSASIQPLEIKTRDNQTIHGYLTTQKNTSKTKLPLVVLPHGGPHGIRDEWGYDWEAQLLANRGYAVLQVNFRGSGGFGLEFQEIGKGKWGTLMQDDLTDATNYLINQNIADPVRICIFGASYGGYAALMGATKEPDLYKCAIGYAGVYDLPMMFEKGNIAKYLINGLAYLESAVGKDVDDMKNRSPTFNVEKIKAEILLVHGAQDSQVPIEQAESLKKALDKIGKSYQWHEVNDEGHGFYSPENRKVVYGKILDFLDQNIGTAK
jgi:dipeptidyl aminopeptidase/acylaminoacyl peptidase